ncbi:rhamnogalacturonan acetylesterase [Dysgonomonas sp. HDW5A]|uniref:rhamnogalacturonan acetylesterase n=1 Tax=unclassified Dysgonomonas TaxID=2630389 RepID=UPI00140C1244|nr:MULTISPECIES: rhamnogalacturonan acetylesterase [unclassified Dysgonomonas]QIK53309.1 rhamnogalacturonan acetylesterase [Dysgonomonas sp. HDW5B]QIK58726.1 rhamnogalacturonan acetylesterase [Dysgonomonas sp. HDW5A]
MRYSRIFISFLLLGFFLLGGTLSAQIKILTIGDSTMANYDEDKNSGEKEMRGWGQMLPLFLTGDIQSVNAAKNGRSSKSFYYEFWRNLRNSLKPGDYVFIQFGHNDEKAAGQDTDPNDETGRGTAAWGQYQGYLQRYVDESRERGAIPILFTPIVRRLFNENNQITGQGLHSLTELAPDDSTMNYPMAMRSLARDLSVPLVDMTLLTQQVVLEYGAEKSKEIIYANNDNTHLKAMGGILYARLAVEDLMRQGILTNYLTLSSDINIKPVEWDFGSQFLGRSTVKMFTLQGLNLNPKSGTVKLSIESPFELLASKSGSPQKELSVSYTDGNLSYPVFVRFNPDKAKNYEGNLLLSVDNKVYQKIGIKGAGLSVKDAQKVQTDWSVNLRESLLTANNIAVKAEVVGLKFVDKNNDVLLTTLDNKWPVGDIDLNASRYLELAISAPRGTFYLDSLSFEMGALGGKYMTFTALASLDKSFAESEDIAVMDDLPNEKFKTYTFNKVLKIPQGETFYIRFYPWYKMEADDKYISIRNVKIQGLLFEK